MFMYDEGVTDGSGLTAGMPGYRDSSNSDTPIVVRLYWVNDGFPEIMDRDFYLIHSMSGNLNSFGQLNRFPLAHIEFTMHDDDPKIQDSSLRFDGESSTEGRAHVTGYQGGDEALLFTCFGCGTCSFYLLCLLSLKNLFNLNTFHQFGGDGSSPHDLHDVL